MLMKRRHLGINHLNAKVVKLDGRDIIGLEFNKIPHHVRA